MSIDHALRKRLVLERRLASKGVLHLGAHLGQEAPNYARAAKPVIWVEALPAIFERLQVSIQPYPNQQAFCAMLSDTDGERRDFYVSNHLEGQSSSMFPFGEHGSGPKALWPQLNLAMTGTVPLSTTRLDTLLRTHGVDASTYDFWIVDLQGAELLALKGAGELLSHCDALVVEASTVDVYQGSVLWPELRQWLVDAGFTPIWEPGRAHDNVLVARTR